MKKDKNTCSFFIFYIIIIWSPYLDDMIHDGNDYNTHTPHTHTQPSMQGCSSDMSWHPVAEPRPVCLSKCVFVCVQRIDPAIASTRALRDMRRVERGGWMKRERERESSNSCSTAIQANSLCPGLIGKQSDWGSALKLVIDLVFPSPTCFSLTLLLPLCFGTTKASSADSYSFSFVPLFLVHSLALAFTVHPSSFHTFIFTLHLQSFVSKSQASRVLISSLSRQWLSDWLTFWRFLFLLIF